MSLAPPGAGAAQNEFGSNDPGDSGISSMFNNLITATAGAVSSVYTSINNPQTTATYQQVATNQQSQLLIIGGLIVLAIWLFKS
jgi:hypothetical protein